MTPCSLFPAAACVQYAIEPGEMERNIATVTAMIDQASPAPGTLVVLPEMWATGFDYPKTAELAARAPQILAAMQEMASRHGLYLAGSLAAPLPGGGLPVNRLYLVGPGGVAGHLDKEHLFAHWQEDRFFQGGRAAGPLVAPEGVLAALVCYDLRFPEAARRQVFAGAGLLAVSAEWPLIRLDHWQALLRARAIENQVFVAAANGCGRTGGMEMAGHSLLIAPDGTVLAEAGNEPAVLVAPLDPERVAEVRQRFFPAGERRWGGEDSAKVTTLEALLSWRRRLGDQGSRVALTNGCFDLLHCGHVSYLEAARRTADCLVVAVNSDRSVRILKGAGRPVNSERDRARVLAALGCVDRVLIFDEETPLALIRALLPDVLVKGADWPEERIVGAAEVKAAGGRVARIDFEHDRSTTGLIETIQAAKTTSPEDRAMILAQLRGKEEQ